MAGIIASVFAAGAPAYATVIGDTVYIHRYYPTVGTVFAPSVTDTVRTPGFEASPQAHHNSINIEEDSIEIDFLDSSAFASVAGSIFDGLQFEFENSTIVDVSVNMVTGIVIVELDKGVLANGNHYINLSLDGYYHPDGYILLDVAFGGSDIVVDVDIKPGSDPNSINLCSNGAVPVAILGSDSVHVSDINTDTLRFAEAAAKVVGKKDPHSLCSIEDVNGDFEYDLVCQYVTTDIAGVDGESTSATVNGEFLDGTPLEGSDTISIVKDTCN